jgi:hypothetical protein
VSGECLGEKYTCCLTIAACKGKRKVKPRFRRHGVSGHGISLLFYRVKPKFKLVEKESALYVLSKSL